MTEMKGFRDFVEEKVDYVQPSPLTWDDIRAVLDRLWNTPSRGGLDYSVPESVKAAAREVGKNAVRG